MARQVACPTSELPPCLVPSSASRCPGCQTRQVDLWKAENKQWGKEERDVVLEQGIPVYHTWQDADLH